MIKVNTREAKARLGQQVEMAKDGEDVVIAENGHPEARMIPYGGTSKDDWFGMDEGNGWIADDFDDLPEGFADIC